LSAWWLTICGAGIVVAAFVAFALSLHPFDLLCGDQRPCDHTIDSGLAQAIAAGAAGLLTVLAIFAANHAIRASEAHFEVEQRPLLVAISPSQAGTTPVLAPMAPYPVSLPNDATAFVAFSRDGSKVYFSMPFQNLGRGLAQLQSVRLRARNVHQYDGRSVTVRDTASYCAPEQRSRVWFHVERNTEDEWVFDVIRRGAKAIAHQGLQARFDVDLVYCDATGRNSHVAQLLLRPSYGSPFVPSHEDPRLWYAEGTRHWLDPDQVEVVYIGGVSDDNRRDRDAAQTMSPPIAPPEAMASDWNPGRPRNGDGLDAH